uniref:KH-like RNA-binding domain-containing protein n=1 Tax=Castor canadensis TaxID=51338 RepID=A0A8C0W9B4_CASCN
MGATAEDIPPWLKVPEDLQEPEVFKIQTHLLEALFGAHGSRIPYIEEMSKVMLELKALESSEFTEVLVYGSYLCKFRTRWMLESMAQCHLQQQEQGNVKLEEAMNDLELGPWMK